MSDSTRWFEQRDGAADRAFEYADCLRKNLAPIIDCASRNYKLYDGRGERVGDYLSPKRDMTLFAKENIVNSVVDTAQALIAGGSVRPSMVTDGADFSVQKDAKNAELWIEGLFQTEDVPSKAVLAFRDGCITPLGAIKVFPNYWSGKPCFIRCTVDQVLVDEWAVDDGRPLEILHPRPVDKRSLIASLRNRPDYERLRELIMRAPGVSAPVSGSAGFNSISGMIEVIEAYRASSFRGSDDGKYGVFVNAAGGDGMGKLVIEWEDYKCHELPFAFTRWTDPTLGFYGTPLVDLISGMQMRTDTYNVRIDEIIDRYAYPTTYVHQSDAGLIAKRVAGVGSTVAYKTTIPQTVSPPVIPPDLINRVDRFHEKSYQLTGISEFAAFGQKPADIRSQPGFQEYADLHSQRFIIRHGGLEKFYIDIARRTLQVGAEMYERGVDVRSTVRMRDSWRSSDIAKRIDWSSIGEHVDDHVMSISTASAISRTPSSRQAYAMGLYDKGLIDKDQTLAILDVPDIRKNNDLMLAHENYAKFVAERLKDGETVRPEPEDGLEKCIDVVWKQLMHLKTLDNVPEEIIDAHRDYMSLAQQLLKKQQNDQAKELAAQQAQTQQALGEQEPGGQQEGQAPDEQALLRSLGVG